MLRRFRRNPAAPPEELVPTSQDIIRAGHFSSERSTSIEPRTGRIAYLENEKLLYNVFNDGGVFDEGRITTIFNRKNAAGKTIMHVAIEHMYSKGPYTVEGRSAVVQLLNVYKTAMRYKKEKRPDFAVLDVFNEPDNNGDTPLHYIARIQAYDDKPIIAFMEAMATDVAGAGIKINVDAINNSGRTAMQVAQELGNRTVREMLATMFGVPLPASGRSYMPEAMIPPLVTADDPSYDESKAQHYGKSFVARDPKTRDSPGYRKLEEEAERRRGGAAAPTMGMKASFGDYC